MRTLTGCLGAEHGLLEARGRRPPRASAPRAGPRRGHAPSPPPKGAAAEEGVEQVAQTAHREAERVAAPTAPQAVGAEAVVALARVSGSLSVS